MPDTIMLPARTDLHGRYDIYGPIHKGLRRAHCSLLARLGSADFDDAASMELLADLRGHLAVGAAHLAHEEEHLHRALEARAPGAAVRLEHEHEEHEARFAQLEALISAMEAAAPAERPALGRTLYLAFGTFVAEDLAHMHQEETVTWPLLCELFADAELIAIEAAIVASHSPAEMMTTMRMIIPALNRNERAGLLGGMKAGAPAEVFTAVIDHAVRPTLPAGDYADLASRLGLAA